MTAEVLERRQSNPDVYLNAFFAADPTENRSITAQLKGGGQLIIDRPAQVEGKSMPVPQIYYNNGKDGSILLGTLITDEPTPTGEDKPLTHNIVSFQGGKWRLTISAASSAIKDKERIPYNYLVGDYDIAGEPDYVIESHEGERFLLPGYFIPDYQGITSLMRAKDSGPLEPLDPSYGYYGVDSKPLYSIDLIDDAMAALADDKETMQNSDRVLLLTDNPTPAVVTAGEFTAAGRIDIGNERTNQEDGALLQRVTIGDRTFLVVSVIDGMGGHAAGEKARDIILDSIQANIEDDIRGTKPQKGIDMQRALIRSTLRANDEVHTYNEKNELNSGAAGVVLLLDTQTGNFETINTGDCRAYMVANGKLQRITTDHSRAQAEVKRGNLTLEQVPTYPHRNEIRSSFGHDDSTLRLRREIREGTFQDNFPYINSGVVSDDAIFVLLSDGVWEEVSDATLEKILTTSATAEEATNRIVEEANKGKEIGEIGSQSGGQDNISAVVVFGSRANSASS